MWLLCQEIDTVACEHFLHLGQPHIPLFIYLLDVNVIRWRGSEKMGLKMFLPWLHDLIGWDSQEEEVYDPWGTSSLTHLAYLDRFSLAAIQLLKLALPLVITSNNSLYLGIWEEASFLTSAFTPITSGSSEPDGSNKMLSARVGRIQRPCFPIQHENVIASERSLR